MRIALLAAVGTAAWLLSPGTAAQQPRMATIEGTVTARGTGMPIDRAHLELRPVREAPVARLPLAAGGVSTGGAAPVPPASRTATSGAGGAFIIPSVPPGEYRLYATRSTGYVPGEYGQRSATGVGVPFAVGPGEHRKVSIVMTPAGTIDGQLFDSLGDPSGHAQVQALRAIYRDGHRSLTAMQLVQADDRGRYRLFWLPPGEYYVCATPIDLRRSSELMHIPPPSRFGAYEQQTRPTVAVVTTSERQDDGTLVEARYVPVCFPGALSERHAAAIRVDAGQQVSGIDINVGPSLVRTFRIRGQVIDGASGRPAAASLQIIPREPPAVLMIPTGSAEENGIFDLPGALPGPLYVAASNGRLNGLTAVDIGGSDVDGITVTMWPGAGIRGQVRLAGSQTDRGPDLSGLVVTIRRHPPVNGLPAAPSSNRTAADGAFVLNNVPPGRYVVEVRLASELYVQSIVLGGQDVLHGGLHVEGRVQGTLDIVVRTGAGGVEGMVFDAARRLAGNVTVVARPEAALRDRLDLYKVATTDDSGRFVLQGLAPGSYELFAWEAVEPGAWHDAEFMQPYADRARSVRVAAAARSAVELTMIAQP